MEVEQALNLADKIIYQHTGTHITTLQREIFCGAWLEKTYEFIAEKCYCSEAHIKSVGKSLWDLLSESLGEKITKKTFRAALERKSQEITREESHKILADAAPLQLQKQNLISDLEFPEGQVKLDSAFYVERPPIETICYEAVVKSGSLIRIKAPRQMGKSSLMVRILHHAAQQNYNQVILDFRLADSKIFSDLDLFLKWFCLTVGRKLGLPNKLKEYWDELLGSKTSCTDYFEKYILAQSDRPSVLALEEVDLIFAHPNLADDFFSLLRAWHEEAKHNSLWKKLRLILVHSTEVYIPLNINQSPFNIGLAIELPEFTSEQVLDLAKRHELDWDYDHVSQLMAMLGGHPYLVRVALYNLTRQEVTLTQFLQQAPTEAGCLGNHLRRHRSNLEKQVELAKAMEKVISSSNPVRVESVTMFKLHSMGLVTFKGNEITPRCELYHQYFAN